ncbi:MAG: host attachment protein [Campylobacterota bacterium]|nr:host attachment protein [Campylobacterota bacterium]
MNFDGHIIIIANLGSLEAYKAGTVKGADRQETRNVSAGTEKENINLTSLKKMDYIEPHTRTSDDMSDQLGNQGHHTGEQHNRSLEVERRGIQQIADDINALISDTKPKIWHLAFPQENLNKLIEMVDVKTKGTLGKSIGKDLTNAHIKDVLSFFE